MPLTARGGGTGLAGGAIPVQGGVVIGFERLNRDPAVRPAALADARRGGRDDRRRPAARARERAALPARPGRRRDQSQIGGNIACNAGGPHAFKYGVTGHWVTGIEAVIPPGEIVTRRRADPQGRRRLRPEEPARRLGGDARARHGRVAAARSRRPELELPVIGLYRDADAGISRDRARARVGRRAGRDRVPRRRHAARTPATRTRSASRTTPRSW